MINYYIKSKFKSYSLLKSNMNIAKIENLVMYVWALLFGYDYTYKTIIS